MRMQVEPEGECREAVFSAKGDSILIPPLSAVQVEYLNSGVYVPIYFGEVRRGGNGRDVYGEDYTLRGMSRRLEEVTLSPGFSTPEQPAHLTVRAIAQDVIGSGQLGTPALVQYVEALCPDLGFNCRAVKDAAQQNPAALLKQIAEDGAKFGVIVKWGVDPQRRFFARAAKSNTRNVTTESPAIRWQQPVAETPCTAVLWYIRQRKDKSWITHLSLSADAATYGRRVKPISVMQGAPGMSSAPWTYTQSSEAAYINPTPDPYALLQDPTDRNIYQGAYAGWEATTDTASIDITFTLTAPAALADLQVFFTNTRGETDTTQYLVLTAPDGRTFTALASEYGSSAAGGYLGLMQETFFSGEIMWPAGTTLRLHAAPYAFTGGVNRAQVVVYRMRFQAPDAVALDGLAAFHYVSPAQEPADIQTSVFVPPTDLPGRVRVEGASVGAAYEQPLEAIEYRITSNGMQMGWMAGQSEDPAALAQASLIKKRDGQAVITALTSQT